MKVGILWVPLRFEKIMDVDHFENDQTKTTKQGWSPQQSLARGNEAKWKGRTGQDRMKVFLPSYFIILRDSPG